MAISSRRLQRAQQIQPLYQGTSIGPQGHRISEMFGGDGNGSWINTPLPAATAIHPDSATAVADLVYNIRQFQTGRPTVPAYPIWNSTQWSATINIIDSSAHPLVPIRLVGSFASQSWAWGTAAMMWAGFPIPPGLEPTNDTDSTLVMIDPDWTWPGRPGDPSLKGRIYELWGAKSPAQNAALGNPAEWTALYAGRLSGVINRVTARPVDRITGDALSQGRPGYWAPKAPMDTSANAGYWGLGPEGVYEKKDWMTTAAHVPFSHQIVRLREIQEGVIRHPIGFLLSDLWGTPQQADGNQPQVWPATGYDAGSRTWMRQGARFRLPAGYTASYPAGMPVSWRPWFDMFITAMRDYGMIFTDTTGNSFSIRGEPGLTAYYPAGFNSNPFLKYLPWEDLQMLAVGSDANFYPTG